MAMAGKRGRNCSKMGDFTRQEEAIDYILGFLPFCELDKAIFRDSQLGPLRIFTIDLNFLKNPFVDWMKRGGRLC